MGDLSLLGEEPARRLREAVESTPGTATFHVNVAVGYGGRREIVDAVRALLNKQLANGVVAEEAGRSGDRGGDLGKSLHARGNPTRIW